MVLTKEQCAEYLNEADHELLRLAKACGPVSNENLIRALEVDGIDDEYGAVLFGLFALQGDDVIERKKRFVADKKRKEIVDDSDDTEEECDPQYEDFLKHLKEHDKSYALVFEEDDGSLGIDKYEKEIESDKERDLEQAPVSNVEANKGLNVVHEKIAEKPDQRRLTRGRKRKGLNVVHVNIAEKQDQRMLTRGRKRKCGPPDEVCGVENQHKPATRSISPNKISNTDKVECIDSPQKRQTGANFPGPGKQENGVQSKIPRVENQQYTSTKKGKIPTHEKSRNETKRDGRNVRLDNDPHVCMHRNLAGKINDQKQENRMNLPGAVKPKTETPNQMPQMENCCEFYSRPASAKNTKRLTPKRLMDEAKNVKTEECSGEERREVKAEKCFESYSEVEIIDEAAFAKKGISNPFVPRKTFDKSMEEEGRIDMFRKEVLDVLEKPYDREEHTRLRQAFRDGGYLEHHPEIVAKLKLHKYRYNRRRRLAMLRGFFFWLQNVSRAGSFKPWKDGACLAVEPQPPSTSA